VRFFLNHLSAPNNSHVALWSPAFRTALLIDKFNRAFASYDASKYDVFAVQMWLRIHRDVKLVPVRVRTTVSHGEYIRLLVVSTVYVLVVEFRTVYAPAFRRAGLIHKSGDDSVKFRAFVRRRAQIDQRIVVAVVVLILIVILKITIRYQSPKVLARFWVRVVEQFEHDSIRDHPSTTSSSFIVSADVKMFLPKVHFNVKKHIHVIVSLGRFSHVDFVAFLARFSTLREHKVFILRALSRFHPLEAFALVVVRVFARF
tara:strand:+ start:1703 stop:2476 length:774 start_codon:yes stop_codon:yes gene_type:complete